MINPFSADYRTIVDPGSQQRAVVAVIMKTCPACARFIPVIEQVAETRKDITFYIIDAMDDQEIARELSKIYKFAGVPTYIFYKDGKPILNQTGAMDVAGFSQLLSEKL